MLNKKFINRRIALSVMTIAVSAVLCGTVAWAGEQDFTLHNKTGVEIHALHISPHSAESWGDDILGQGTMGNGDSLKIKFSRAEKASHWDLRIEDSEGHSLTWESLNLLEIAEVTLHYKDGKAWADLE